jgi:hypothetical protein
MPPELKERRWLPVVIALCCTFTSYATGQTASSLSLSGLSTSSLNPPAAPLSVTGYGTCSGAGTNTWGYAVAAVDGAGGTTTATSFGPTTTGSCLSLTNSNYFTFTTQPVAGAVSCIIYRTATPGGSNLGKIGNVLCGWPFFDVGQVVIGPGTASINTTGSISASGNVGAFSFTAGGMSAGTSVWMQGGPLSGCGNPVTQPQPCIPSTNAFFLDAPNSSILTSFGWTAPSSANTTAEGPLIVGQATGSSSTLYTSNLSVGTFTDSSSTTPVVVTANGSSFSSNDLVYASISAGQVNLADTGINLSTGPLKIPWDAIGSPLSANQSLAMGSKTTTWTWSGSQSNPEFSFQGGNGADTTDYVLWQAGNATGSKNFFDITDTTTNSGTGSLLNVFTTSGSGMSPFTASAGGTANGVQLSAGGILAKLGTGHVNADECNGNNCPSFTGTPNANDMAVWGSAGTLIDDTLLVDSGTALTYAAKFSVNSSGIITKMSNTTTVGVAGMTYDTPSAASSGNITSTQLWAGVGGGTHMGKFSWYVEQTGAGSTCTGNTTVVLNVIYNPPSKASALTQSLGTLTIASSGNGAPGNFVSNGTYPIGIKSGTAVSYSTTGYNLGSGCTTNPTYTVYPVFELFF